MVTSVSYFPGCTLHGTAREYSESIEAVCKRLGVELAELDDWNCCGASSAHVASETLATSLPARNLEIASRAGKDLVTPCAACYQRLKLAELELSNDGEKKSASKHSFQIKHLVDFLWEDVGEEAIGQSVKVPLKGLKPVSYYGCLTVRPYGVGRETDSENPHAMDRLLRALDADVKDWSYKTDCCGGSLALTNENIIGKLVTKLVDKAVEAGADCIATACPMCFSNLDTTQARLSQEDVRNYAVPILYISELIGIALGEPSARKWLTRHMVDPAPLLRQKGLV